MSSHPTLVIGSAGRTGRRIAGRLADPPFSWEHLSAWPMVFDGRNAGLGDGVQEALGREPRDICKTAASGVWQR